MDHASLVLTVIGPDRPGIVQTLASVVASHGGNWVESRMARLAGQFAGVLRVDVPPDRAEALARELRNLSGHDLTVTLATPAEPDAPQAVQELTLEVIGHDRPGIVREVSHALASRGVNVVELATECFSAPMSGEPMFKAQARLHAPRSVALDDLRRSLDQIEAELGLDISLDEAISR